MAKNAQGTVKTINTEHFDDAISKFKAAIDTYREARERIFDTTDALLFSWEGKGKDAFEREYEKLCTKLTDEEDNLNTIKEDLENCRQSYLDWDSEVSSQFKGN